MNKNLVILPVGSKSITNQWASDRQFDLWTFSFDKSGVKDKYADRSFHVPLFKYHALKFLLETEDVSQYEYFWFPDDDLVISTENVNDIFAIAKANDLQLGQVSVNPDTHRTWHWYLRQNKKYEIRRTNYVEVMCPFFNKEFLLKCLHTFNSNLSSYGIDIEWSFMTDPRRTAIIDKFSVSHIRPVRSGDLYSKLNEMSVNPTAELKEIMKKYGLETSTLDFLYIEGGIDFE